MFLVKNDISPPSEWFHDPNIVNNQGLTVSDMAS